MEASGLKCALFYFLQVFWDPVPVSLQISAFTNYQVEDDVELHNKRTKVPVQGVCVHQQRIFLTQYIYKLIVSLVCLQLHSASVHFISAQHTSPDEGSVEDITFHLVSFNFFTGCHVSASPFSQITADFIHLI